MDHSNCPNPEECKVYEYYAKLMDDPDQWWERSLPKKRSEKRQLDTIVSVRLNSAQLRALHAAAKARNMTISRFIRESALKAAAIPYVKIISVPPLPVTFTA
jgi:hypothetical protein